MVAHSSIDHTGITGVGAAAFAGARVYNNANIALGTATETVLTFNSERFDTDAFHSTAANTSRLTIPSGKAGKYLIGCNVRVTGTPGESYMLFYLNGATAIAMGPVINAGVAPGLLVTMYDLAVADYVEVAVYVTNGSKNAQVNANYSPEFWLAKIG